jgi:adenine specific DNA methylase Mod
VNHTAVILDWPILPDSHSWSSPIQEPEMPRGGPAQQKLFENRLFYGDNLRILRTPGYIREESVDLVYLDPPFKPTEKYNVLFRARSGTPAAAQVRAFEDTWHWDDAAVAAFYDVRENSPRRVVRTLEALQAIMDKTDAFAYLCMMAPRLVQLHKVLKETGSLYLHCDPAASHYLKVLLDAVFGPEHFRSEIIWKRSTAHSDTKQGRRLHGQVHDVILFYTKGDQWTWNPVYTPYDQSYIDSHYRWTEEGTGRRYRKGDLTAAKPGGDTEYEWHGVRPYPGRYWAYSQAKMQAFEREGRLIYTRSGMPEYKRYLDEMPGVPLQDVWTDIDPLNAKAAEREGYPTQKPMSLLDRIIESSTDARGVVLDPFCGCGTTIAAAQRLGRYWVGIDIAYEAIRIIRGRLGAEAEYHVYGDPESLEDAEQLARDDPYQFQWWAVRRLGARETEFKKGADKGIDGRLFLRSDRSGDRLPEAIISVKAGRTGPAHVREVQGTMEAVKAEVGVLVTLQPATAAMRSAAAAAESYTDGRRWYPRLQLLSAADIIAGKGVEYPAGVEVTQEARTSAESTRPAISSSDQT